jgi:Yip1 domain
MGPFARIVGVFFEPKKTFEEIAARPTWFPPLLLIVVATLAFMIIFTQHIGWENVVRQQLENSPRTAQMTPDQRELAITQGAKFAPFIGYLTVILVPLGYLLVAAILLGLTAMMSGGLKFNQIFAVVCYSGLPSIVFSILATAVMFLKSPTEFNIQNPLVFNVGAFMDPSGSKKLWTLGTSLDLFSFWMIFLIATGLKAAAGKRLSFGQALFAVILPWAVYVGIKSAIA